MGGAKRDVASCEDGEWRKRDAVVEEREKDKHRKRIITVEADNAQHRIAVPELTHGFGTALGGVLNFLGDQRVLSVARSYFNCIRTPQLALVTSS